MILEVNNNKKYVKPTPPLISTEAYNSIKLDQLIMKLEGIEHTFSKLPILQISQNFTNSKHENSKINVSWKHKPWI